MKRLTPTVAVLLGLAGCPSRSDLYDGDMASAAVEAEPTVAVFTELPTEIVVAGENAELQTLGLDARCATIPIAASATERRPGGVGCPRPASGSPETWGPTDE